MRKSALYAFGLVVLGLVALGLITLASAGGANGVRLHGDPYFFAKRQFVYFFGGLVVVTVASLVDYRFWRDRPLVTLLAFAAVFLLLLAVFPPLGRKVNGSYRWINLGFFNLQPSEFAKLMTVITVAAVVDRLGWKIEMFKTGAVIPAAVIALMAGPIILEPDFGSCLVVSTVGVLLMLAGGVKLHHLGAFATVGGAYFAYKVVTNPNRLARILAYLGCDDIVAPVLGTEKLDVTVERAAYQVNQAIVAIQNGGISGVGLGESMQKHYYLPEAHTDFIFAVGAEELGLIYSICVVALFVLFFLLSVYIAKKACDRFGRLLVIGMAYIIFFQAMFNLGVVCKALPTKGMALPFFSYGGTNMLSAFFAVGTILSVGIHSYRDGKRQIKRSVLA